MEVLRAMWKRRSLEKNGIGLSVCIITQDSAHCIGRAIRSVEDCCDEIIVVDGGSSDNTAEISRSFDKVRYYHHPWKGDYVEQKNRSFNLARGDWIFSLDSDEVVGRRLKRRLPGLIRSRRFSSYMFPRYWLVSESPLRRVDSRKLYRDYQQRLFRNTPEFRYTSDRKIHHKFPDHLQGKGRKIRTAHIFHFELIFNDRAARERKVRQRMIVDPLTTRVDRTHYLYEDYPYTIRKCHDRL
jgi:glycosyltransferase involved in cell wall biosynthesis